MTSGSSWLVTNIAPLQGREIHVWRAALDLDPAGVDGLEKTLASDERARAARFRFPKDRKRFVARRGILREILASYLGQEPRKLQFRCRPGGKPFLSCRTHELHFNLAHSQGLALYAIACQREVGVDLERIEHHLADLEVAERFFSPRECWALRNLPASLRVEAFFNCWTRKEAYLKARGEGLLAPLDSFDVSVTPSQPAALLNGGDTTWSLCALTPAPGYAAALVWEGSDCNLKQWEWRPGLGRAVRKNRRAKGCTGSGHCFSATRRRCLL